MPISMQQQAFANWMPLLKRGPANLGLGLMTPRRKLASAAYLPGPKAREPLFGGKIPFWYAATLTLTQGQTGDTTLSLAKNFVLCSLSGVATRDVGSFITQLYHWVSDKVGFRFSRVGIQGLNIVGSGRDPFVLRRPYYMPLLTALMLRVQNSDLTHSNTIQICAFGFMD